MSNLLTKLDTDSEDNRSTLLRLGLLSLWLTWYFN